MSRSTRLVGAVGLALAAGLTACGPRAGDGVRLSDAWARPGAAGETSAAYLTIANDGAESEVLTGVDCPSIAVCELHQTMVEGDMVHMEPQDRFEIPAGGQISLQPGGMHIMLMNLSSDLAPGDWVSLVLHFENAGDMPVEAEVVAP
jgi:copper(I)-binding protein